MAVVYMRPGVADLGTVTEEGLRLGAALRAIRKEKGLTQVQVAQRWGMAPGSYAPYEQGRRQLPHTAFPSLAKALGVSTAELSSRVFGAEPTPDEAADATNVDMAALLRRSPAEMARYRQVIRVLPPEVVDAGVEQAMSFWDAWLRLHGDTKED